MRISIALSVAAAWILSLPASAAVDWRPIDESLLALDQPKLDPDADAEALLWEVWIADEIQGTMLQTEKTHYVRIKVFTERGVEEQGTVEIPSVSKMKIHDLRGRTIKPDGRIVELEKAEIFERDVMKAGNLRVRTQSFSMPNVEPGDVIEYQWREIYDNSLANNLRLYFDRDIPTWKIVYHLKQSRLAIEYGYTMRTQPFNFEYHGWEQEAQGFWTTYAENLPAFKEEPYMPPEDQVRAWLLVFYAREKFTDPERYWGEVGKGVHERYGKELKPTGALKRFVPEVVGDAATAEEKIAAIRKFCIEEVRNIGHDRSGVSGEERADFKANKDPADTLKKRMGASYDINFMFGSLARAAGLDARIARLPRRDDRFFDRGYLNEDFLTSYVVAVDVDGDWRFYDPASPYLTDGMLNWAEEGVPALVADPKKANWIQTPFTPADKTGTKHTAEFELLPDGTLQGKVRHSYLGHYSISNKRVYDGLTEEERVERIEENVTNRFSTAEVSNVKIENADSVSGEFAYSYEVKIPGYAVRTGKRIFLQPSFFRRNYQPRFKTSDRIHDLYFRYGWSETNQVLIKLPEGFDLEDADAPQGMNVQDVGSYTVSIGLTPDRYIVYGRNFIWGLGGNIMFPAKAYPQVKSVFDAVQKADDHMLTLIESEGASGQ